ncbi:YwiC-like family protein [Leptolyngbya ohadii]|uniref:YwiC-like family protein n=1 Tax=Leptolyngbya ohadii TaxID=1962290 RepID=UPI000B59BA34|nr:YwiC-like family protein [Leptolyngbya ohadii]
MSPSLTASSPRNPQAWYRPVFSHEHGVYVMLFVSFLTGAAAAQQWTIATTLALICAFFGFQAEHPIVLQIKQRRSWKPRFLFWGGLYGGTALAIALYLWLSQASIRGELGSPLLAILGGAALALAIDAVSVLYREQKSIWNELITFAAVCLAAPFAHVATIGSISNTVIGLWLLNTLFFASAIFTVKFRKDKTHSPLPSLTYHTIAPLLLVGVALLGWLSPYTIAAFAVALLKYGLILWQREWYCTTKIQRVAMLETVSAMLFLAIVSLTLLPAHLPL